MHIWSSAHGAVCASQGCAQPAAWHFEAHGVGSDYCHACRDRIDDHLCQDDDLEARDDWDDLDAECGLARDGQCSMAGSEHCDFCCPNRNSDLFVGSAAWRAKHQSK